MGELSPPKLPVATGLVPSNLVTPLGRDKIHFWGSKIFVFAICLKQTFLDTTQLGGTAQTHNQGGAKPPLEHFSPPLEKCVGYSLKLLDIVQKIWAPLRKLFAPPGVPSWLRAWNCPPMPSRGYVLAQMASDNVLAPPSVDLLFSGG